jgi:predicted short-subunit dehydrogenase-like oxidoreductase (DUF2520 family)
MHRRSDTLERDHLVTESLVGIAGTGRMAKALGALMVRRGIGVSAVAGRCSRSVEEAGRFIGAARAVTIGELPVHAQRILIAVTDGAIPEVAAELAAVGLRGGTVLHTSGATGPQALDVLRDAGNAVGVLHPLQTVPSAERGVEALPGATFALAGDGEAMNWAVELTERLGGRALRVDAERWHHYHAGAVMACNYQMTLVDAALELMGMAGIGRDVALDALGSILRQTTENVLKLGPEHALTGPIRRGDLGTIVRHLAAVEGASPETKRLYVAAGLRTIAIAERAGLEKSAAGEVARMLEGESR